jgi:PAS domain S-box-containing protein
MSRYVAHAYVKARTATRAADEARSVDRTLNAIVETLKSTLGADFRFYRTGTLQRRIQRRMALRNLSDWDAYLEVLRNNETEADELVKDVLINVTGFFRDPDAFAALAAELGDLVRTRPSGQPLRVWVAGCSTGEEAYSIGMLLLEQIQASGRAVSAQIFATDVDEEALEIARAGVYPQSIEADVSPERLELFFIRQDGTYKVGKTLRDTVIFSRHDALHDPPFSRLDLVSCRNLMIYLVPEAQRHVLSMFHFALAEDALLLLGSAESVNSGPGLFDPVDEKQRLFRRHGHGRMLRAAVSVLERGRGPGGGAPGFRATPPRIAALPDMIQRVMLQTYAPAAVVVDRNYMPLYFFGPADRYLQVAPGEPNQDVLTLAREGLRPKLRETVARAFRLDRLVSSRNVLLKRNGRTATVTIEAQPVPDSQEDLVLVAFADESPKGGQGERISPKQPVENPELRLLRQQVSETRRELNRTIHELRATNEELKAKNEEATSLNEEFVSTNEELEASKEELQSLNEELTTVNHELRQTLDQQVRVSTDFSNLLNSSSTAIILLDAELRIKLFNPKMRELFALIEADVGRPLADLAPRIADPDLLADVAAASTTGTVTDREIRAPTGVWWARSALPYFTETGKIEGAVVTFADVSVLKRAGIEAASARAYAETVVDAVGEPLAVIDANLELASANTAFCDTFGLSPDKVAGTKLSRLGGGLFSDPRLREMAQRLAAQPGSDDGLELEAEDNGGRRRIWRVALRSFVAAPSPQPMVLMDLRDVTAERRVVREQLRLMMDALPGPVIAVDQQGRIRFANAQTSSLFGYAPAELAGAPVSALVPGDMADAHAVLHEAFAANPQTRPMAPGREVQGRTKDGVAIPLEIGLSALATAEGPLIIAAIHDLRELQKGAAEREALRASLATELSDMQRMHDQATRLIGTAELHEVLEEILAATIDLQHAAFGNVQLYEPETRSLRIVAQQGFPDAFLEHFATSRAGDGTACGRALEARKRVIVEDVEQDPAFAPHRAIAAQVGFRAVQSTPIFARDGTLVGMLSTHFRTPYRPSDRELRLTDLYLRMAADLIERTHAERQLQAAWRGADQANEAKTRFLAAASHDLRQPLQAIRLLHGVLERRVTDPEARGTLAKADEAVAFMTGLLDSLLDIDQLERGLIRVEIAMTPLAPLLARIASDFAPAAAEKGLRLRVMSSSAVAPSDQRLLIRMMNNLVSNAIKYTDRGEVLVGCRRRGEDVRIEVWDTGIGIPEGSLEPIFEEFHRVDRMASRPGLGLGLYIVDRFAKLLGHGIEVRSTPGKGTMFAIVIHGAAFARTAGASGRLVAAAASAEPSILLVEDDPAQLNLLRLLLEHEGYRVTAASRGDEALAQIRGPDRVRPDIIVSDYNLPGGMNGLAVIRRVRDELGAELPALIVSGVTPLAPDLSKAGVAGLTFIPKPVKADDLLAMVRAMARAAKPDWTATPRSIAAHPASGAPDSDVAVIDDEPSVRDAIRTMLEAEGHSVATYGSAEAFFDDEGRGRFRCLVVDVDLPGMDGLQLQERLKQEGRAIPLIFVTGRGDLPLAVKAIGEGAADFLQKPVRAADLGDSLARALAHAPAPQEEREDFARRLASLTPREREVLDKVVAGELNKNIAAGLGISQRTTEHHRQALMRKMGARSLAALVRMVGLNGGG